MNLNIYLSDQNAIERFLLIMNLGVLMALKEGAIEIEEAENVLYSPYSVKTIERIGVNKEILLLIQLGCELEDIESLLPKVLHSSIEELKDKCIALLKKFPKNEGDMQKWLSL